MPLEDWKNIVNYAAKKLILLAEEDGAKSAKIKQGWNYTRNFMKTAI